MPAGPRNRRHPARRPGPGVGLGATPWGIIPARGRGLGVRATQLGILLAGLTPAAALAQDKCVAPADVVATEQPAADTVEAAGDPASPLARAALERDISQQSAPVSTANQATTFQTGGAGARASLERGIFQQGTAVSASSQTSGPPSTPSATRVAIESDIAQEPAHSAAGEQAAEPAATIGSTSVTTTSGTPVAPAYVPALASEYRRLSGQTALVTGGDRGIGAAIVRDLARRGANVVINYNRATSRKGADDLAVEVEARYGVKALVIQGDALVEGTPKKLVDAAWDRFEGLDIVILNAGITDDNYLARMTPESWDRVWNVNFVGPYRLMREAIARSRAKGKKLTLIGNSSISADVGQPGQANYATSKRALNNLLNVVTAENPGWVRGVAISPGLTESNITKDLPAWYKGVQSFSTPEARLAKPEEIAEAFGAVAETSWIAAQKIAVDGGLTGAPPGDMMEALLRFQAEAGAQLAGERSAPIQPRSQLAPFSDRVALVTGATRGLGREIALQFARGGANVVFNYLSDDEGAKTLVQEIEKLGGRAVFVKGDIGEYATGEDLVALAKKEFGRLDFVVPNAGVWWSEPMADTTDETLARVIGINARGVFNTVKPSLRLLLSTKRNNEGGQRLAYIGSTSGSGPGIPKLSVYGPTKTVGDVLSSVNMKENHIPAANYVIGYMDTALTGHGEDRALAEAMAQYVSPLTGLLDPVKVAAAIVADFLPDTAPKVGNIRIDNGMLSGAGAAQQRAIAEMAAQFGIDPVVLRGLVQSSTSTTTPVAAATPRPAVAQPSVAQEEGVVDRSSLQEMTEETPSGDEECPPE